jgi:SAM-dependent methyltransferase
MVCPVCKSNGHFEFYTQKKVVTEQQFVMHSRQEALACKRGDIKLAFCSNCGLIWNIAFDPTLLDYSSAYNATQMLSPVFQNYTQTIAKQLIENYNLHLKEVLEIGCGDGYFLSLLSKLGPNKGVGFDPSWKKRNPADAPKGIQIIPDYYSDKYSNYQGDLLCCRHVLDQIEDPVAFINELKRLTQKRRPVFFFEVLNMYLSLRSLAFWDIFYERCIYFTLPSLRYIFESSGFEVSDAQEGFNGQFAWVTSCFNPEKQSNQPPNKALKRDIKVLADSVKKFSTAWLEMKGKLQDQVNRILASKSSRVVIWGAGAKVVTFLNILNLQPKQIEFIVDINEKKWGTFISGSGQEIVSPEFLIKYQPDYVLVMNPEYINEITVMLNKLNVKTNVLLMGEKSKVKRQDAQ